MKLLLFILVAVIGSTVPFPQSSGLDRMKKVKDDDATEDNHFGSLKGIRSLLTADQLTKFEEAIKEGKIKGENPRENLDQYLKAAGLTDNDIANLKAELPSTPSARRSKRNPTVNKKDGTESSPAKKQQLNGSKNGPLKPVRQPIKKGKRSAPQGTGKGATTRSTEQHPMLIVQKTQNSSGESGEKTPYANILKGDHSVQLYTVIMNAKDNNKPVGEAIDQYLLQNGVSAEQIQELNAKKAEMEKNRAGSGH